MAIMIRQSKTGFPYIKMGDKLIWIREVLESGLVNVRGSAVLLPFCGVRLVEVNPRKLGSSTSTYKLIPEDGVVTTVLSGFPGIGGEVSFNAYRGEELILSKLDYKIRVDGGIKFHRVISFTGDIEVEITSTGKFAPTPRVMKLSSNELIKKYKKS